MKLRKRLSFCRSCNQCDSSGWIKNFGEGTKLIMIPSGVRLPSDISPKPIIFLPSVAEINLHKAGTYLCLLDKFFPDVIKVYWKEKNGNTILESQEGHTMKTDNTYMKLSWLTVTEKSMDKEHKCIVKHENNKGGVDQEILFPSVIQVLVSIVTAVDSAKAFPKDKRIVTASDSTKASPTEESAVSAADSTTASRTEESAVSAADSTTASRTEESVVSAADSTTASRTEESVVTTTDSIAASLTEESEATDINSTKACLKDESTPLQLQLTSTSAYHTYILLLLASAVYFAIINFRLFRRTAACGNGKSS
uniref:Ig-like domain-containing protein n=2 Tax=Equus caballus TaxID=9796 RepID=A0A3Q2L775_HORSE